MTARFSFAIFILAGICCGTPSGPAASEPDASKAAKALCNCVDPLLAANADAQKSLDSLAFVKVAKAFEEAKRCALALQIDETLREQLTASLEVHCPQLAPHTSLMEELLSLK